MLRRIAMLCLVTVIAGCAGSPQQKAPTSTPAPASTPTAAPKPALAGPTPGGTLTVALNTEPVHLDPNRVNDCGSVFVHDFIADSLVTLDENLNPAPHLAESWEASPDGITWTFKLRKDVKFHDGSPLTAEDVAFSFHRILDRPEFSAAKYTKINMIQKVEAVDPHTVRVTLKRPYSPFLGAARQHIVSKKAVEAMGEDAYSKKPIASGPFKVQSWVKGEGVVLVRNEDYWLTKAHLDKIVVRPIVEQTSRALSLVAGEVDVALELSDQMLARVRQAGMEVVKTPMLNYGYLGMRLHLAPGNDTRFRLMVKHAVDWDKLVEAVYGEGALRAYGPVAPGLWPREADKWKEQTPKYDPEKAKQLLAELIRDGAMKADTEIGILTHSGSPAEKVAEIVVSSLRAIGVKANVKAYEWAAFLERVRGDKEGHMYTLGTTAALTDPDAVFNWLYHSKSSHGGLMVGLRKVDNSEVDKLIERGAAVLDRAEREKIYNTLTQKVVFENNYHVPLTHNVQFVGMNPKVQDLYDLPICGNAYVSATHNVWIKK